MSLLALVAALTLSGQVLDAATGKPVAGALVEVKGDAAARCESDRDGRFACAIPGARAALSFSHRDYQTLQHPAGVSLGPAPLLVRLAPKVLTAPEVEIETTHEQLKPSLFLQEPLAFPLSIQRAYAGKRVERLHRVCVGRDGAITSVTSLSPDEPDLDAKRST